MPPNSAQPKSTLSDVPLAMEVLTVEMLQDHCHEIEEDKDNRNKARNQLLVASIVCLLFMVGEIVGKLYVQLCSCVILENYSFSSSQLSCPLSSISW